LGYWDLPWTVVTAFIVALHGLWVRKRPATSPEVTLTIDALAIASYVLAGIAPVAAGAILFYFVIVPFVVLPRRRVRPMIIRLGSIVIPSMAVSLIFDLTRVTGLPAQLINIGVDVLVLGVIGLLCSVSFANIREMRAHEAAALRAEQEASSIKTEFVSMVSHELRTPLTAITGFTQTLQQSWDEIDAQDAKHFLQIISDQSDHLRRLVEDLLLIPRLESGQLRLEPAVVELRPLVQQVANLVFPGRAATGVSIHVPPEATVWADPHRIVQVVRNLMENAIKYGGSHVKVEGKPLGDKFMVGVVDDGPGIPAEDRERIFDPFERLVTDESGPQRGFGLGLPIARKLVRAMGGNLWVEAALPTGSRFCFTLISGL
jgi:signal transduction histidine kinase